MTHSVEELERIESFPIMAGQSIAHITPKIINYATEDIGVRVHKGLVEPGYKDKLPENIHPYVITDDRTSLGATEVFVESENGQTQIIVTPDQMLNTLADQPGLLSFALEPIVIIEDIDPANTTIIAHNIGKKVLSVLEEGSNFHELIAA